MKSFAEIEKEIVSCNRCQRLRQWCRAVATNKAKRYNDWTYWGKPVPGFGDPHAEIIVVGLAPGAHGANRTGRLFTGDRSGDWLFRALHKVGLSNQSTSVSRNDGLQLTNCYITAVCRCAPPQNKPTRQELQQCREYFINELQLLTKKKVLVCLGAIAFETTLECCKALGYLPYTVKPKFAHGSTVTCNDSLVILASYHPSQQNTFTKRLTESMFDAIFTKAIHTRRKTL